MIYDYSASRSACLQVMTRARLYDTNVTQRCSISYLYGFIGKEFMHQLCCYCNVMIVMYMVGMFILLL